MRNLSIIYYTANKISNYFAENVRKQLIISAGEIPIISVSQKPINFGENICVGDIGCSTLNIYRQATLGVKNAKTKFIALAEDDAFYTLSHFDFIPPRDDTFYYNENIWGIYTWTKPSVFSYKGRRSLWTLICERDLFIEVMEERFAKYNDNNVPEHLFGEPGKYEKQMGVKVNRWEFYHSKEPSVVFSHSEALSYLGLGKRKKLGLTPRTELFPWGSAEKMLSYYNK